MQTHEIYRDFYHDSEPTLGDKAFLLSKRICMMFAGVALALGVLDVCGVHSIVGAKTVVQGSQSKFADLGEKFRSSVAAISFTAPSIEKIKVSIPVVENPIKFSTKKEPTVIDELAAARKQDAVQLAMTSTQPTFAVASTPSATLGAAKSEPKIEQKSAKSALSAFAALSSSEPIAPAPIAVPARIEPVSPPNPVQMASLTLPENPVPAPALAPASAPVETAVAPAVTPDVEAPASIVLPDKVPLPHPAPPLSPAERLNLKGAAYAKAERCLANAIYFESRSEPVRGQMAVAQVVLNRVFSPFYPNDVCSVIYQNASRHLSCQFTFACDGKSKAITDRGSWGRANRIARQTLDGQIYVPEVGKSTHYHATYVRPGWAREMHRLVRFGVHNFYRPYAWGRGDEQPIWGTAAMAQQIRLKQASAVTTR